MTVEFPSSYPVNIVSASKPVDVQALQDAFAAALRNYGTEKGGTTANTILEVLRPASHADDSADHDRNQQHREQQRQTDRSDFTSIDRKLQDKSEIRNSDMNSAYWDRMDRNKTFQSDYRERVEQHERETVPPTNTANLATLAAVPLDVAQPSESVPIREPASPQPNLPATASANSPSVSVNAPNSTTTPVQTNMVIPGAVRATMPNPAAQPTVLPTFTIFTPTGRLGQAQRKTDEKEDEEEEPVEGKETKKHQPFAVFEEIRLARQDVLQQSKEPTVKKALRQAVEAHREKPKETEPNQGVKTLDELLNVPAQNITVAKKGEPKQPDQTQYMKRIAAACEVSSHLAPIRVKLNLDHLGTLTLYFFHKANKLTLRFETPSKESAQFISGHLDGLRTLLSKRNVKIADMEILPLP